MSKYLPLVFLASTFAFFGIVWIVWDVDPERAEWYVFAALISLIFCTVWGFLGLVLYFLRTKLYRRFSKNWYFHTSFKMAFFVAMFLAVICTLIVLKLLSDLNLILVISAVSLFAFWSYLGKKIEK